MKKIFIASIISLGALIVSSCNGIRNDPAIGTQLDEVTPFNPTITAPSTSKTPIIILDSLETSTPVFSHANDEQAYTGNQTSSLDSENHVILITPTPNKGLLPREWPSWPVVPVVSSRMREIFEYGLEHGNSPKVFSIVGDCQSEPNVFLGIYETDRYYFTDEYSYLENTIAFFRGSFSHKSQAVKDGLSAPSALSPLWADQGMCETSENPVQCELRIRKPAIMFVNLGTNWKAGASADAYKGYLKQIVRIIIDNGTIPVLSTKADNVEGDHSINRATANVAYELDVPLWNFWLAADTLPNHGLDGSRDNIYLTPEGWDRRNFTALLVLDSLWKGIDLQNGAASNGSEKFQE